jgi:hypothetical protein
VPAAIAPIASASALKLAVTTEPFSPKETLLEFENVTALRLLLVVPAEILKLYDAVICEDPLIPNEILFEFE